MDTAVTRPPRLASDPRRTWIAVGLSFVPILGVGLGLRILDPVGLGADATFLSYLAGWVVGCPIWIVLTVVTFSRARPEQLRAWLMATRAPSRSAPKFWWSVNGGGAIWWAITGASLTLVTLVILAVAPRAPGPVLLWTGAAVVVCSAAIIIVSFAVHYARLDATGGGFGFPGRGTPRFADYLYLAVQISTTFGASDVALETTRVRRAVSFHSLVSSTFNTVLVALLVSVLLRAAG